MCESNNDKEILFIKKKIRKMRLIYYPIILVLASIWMLIALNYRKMNLTSHTLITIFVILICATPIITANLLFKTITKIGNLKEKLRFTQKAKNEFNTIKPVKIVIPKNSINSELQKILEFIQNSNGVEFRAKYNKGKMVLIIKVYQYYKEMTLSCKKFFKYFEVVK